jgi:hypothetical protein
METNRPRATGQISSTNGKGTRAVDHYKKTRKPDDSNHFLVKLFAYPGAKDAFEALETGGMSREATIAFLLVIASHRDVDLKRELPRPKSSALRRRVSNGLGTRSVDSTTTCTCIENRR